MAGYWDKVGQNMAQLPDSPWLHMGMGLLQAGQWSDKPQGIGSGLLAGMQSYQAAQAAAQARQVRDMQLEAMRGEIGDKKAMRELAGKYLKPSPGILGYGVEAGTDQARGLLQPSGDSEFDAMNLAATNDALNSIAPAGQAQAVQGPRGQDFKGYMNAAVAAGLLDPLKVQEALASMRPKIKEYAKTDKGIVPLYDNGEAGAPLDYRDPTKKDDLVQAQDKDGNLVWITPEQALSGGFAVPSEVAGQMDTGGRKLLYDKQGRPIFQADVTMDPYQAGQLGLEGERVDIARDAETRQQAALGANVQQAQQEYNLAKRRVDLEQQKMGQASQQAQQELALKREQLAQAQQAGGKPKSGPQLAGMAGLDGIRKARSIYFDDNGEFRRGIAAGAMIGDKGMPGWGEARTARSSMEQAIQAYALQITGTTFTNQQMNNLRATFFPTVGDDTKSAKDKFERLENFLSNLAGNKAQPKAKFAPPTDADIQATARKYGMTPDQVRAQLRQKGLM